MGQDPHELLVLAEQLGMLGAEQAEQLRDELAQGRVTGSGDELRERLGLPPVVFEALLSMGGQGQSLSASEERSLLTQMIRAYQEEASLRGQPGMSPVSANAKTLSQFIDKAGVVVRADRSSSPEARPTGRLGRYPVTGLLGEGGMGQVLEVRDDHLGRQMAAKVIKGQADPAALVNFVREAQITGQLEHPNIIPTHELGVTDEGTFYFTMKRIEGADLAGLLDGRKARGTTLFEYLQIFLKVCDAMSLAHERGVIHRDLKPANIMVGRFGEVQVMDWGLARLVGQPDPTAAGCTLDLGSGALAERARQRGAGEPLKTLDGMVVGTPHYMPPEQARAEVTKLDRRADVYALGAILYQILTLEAPYRGRNAWAVLAQVIKGPPQPPSKRTPEREVPRELEAVVLKAMAPMPRQRYDTVALMKQDIEAYLEGRLLHAAQYNSWQVLRKWAGRNKPAVVAAAGILIAMIAAVVGISLQLGVARAKEREARTARKEAEASERKAVAALEARNLAMHKGEAIDWVRKAMELYTRKGDRDKVLDLLVKAKRQHPDHSGLLRLRGRMALDQQEWTMAKELLDRARERDRKDYITHFLLFRWYAEQGRGNTVDAKKHIDAAAEYATRDSAIGLMAHGRREYSKAGRLSGEDRTGALERGVDFCTQALAKQADFALALVTRGFCHRALESWEEALADLDAVVALVPKAAYAYCNRGILYAGMKRYDMAMADLKKAISLAPKLYILYYNRGNLHKEMMRYDEAIADFDKGISFNPRAAMLYGKRGFVHHEMKRYEKALADYDKGISLDPRNADVYNNRGRVYAAMKRHDEALADYGHAIRVDPLYFLAYQNRGNLHRDLQRYGKARADYDKAISLAPRLAIAYTNRGRLHELMQRYGQALADHDQAIQIDPELTDAYVNRGDLHADKKRYEKALADYDQAIHLDPGLAAAFNGRGLLHQAMKRYAKALADYDQSIRIEPERAASYNNRGRLHGLMKRYGQALVDYTTAIRIEPGSFQTYNNRGVLYMRMKRYEQALADYDHAIRIAPEFAGSYSNRGLLKVKMKRLDRALADYGKAISLDPRYANAYYNRGVLYQKMKRLDKALADYDKAISIDPRHANAHISRGRLHLQMKRYDKALADFDATIRLDPGRAVHYHKRGHLHHLLKQHDKALADYGQAIRIDPRDAQAYYSRGSVYLGLKRYDKALADYAVVIRIDPHNAIIYNTRGVLYFRMKQYDKALADYAVAIRIDPRFATAYENRALVHNAEKRYRLAIADWQRALPLVRGTAREQKIAGFIVFAQSKIK